MSKELIIPAITGMFSQWRYYQAIMTIRTITDNIGTKNNIEYRIKTVEEVKEIYSKDINEMLQRVFDKKRLIPIKNYLLKQKDRYINNLTVAIYGGEPEWLPIELSFIKALQKYDKNYIEKLGKSFGIIKLSGDEVLFVLDGQHRLRGLREAIKEDENLKNQEIAITFISHKTSANGKKRTRRLFSTINRYAKPVSMGENILLDEDDLSAIIVRTLINDYPLFKDKNVIALNKSANLTKRDKNKLTTVISLWNVNEVLLNNDKIYPKYEGSKRNSVRIRPHDEVIEKKTKKIFNFWNIFFSYFNKAKEFVKNPLTIDYRIDGGPFYLRPIGQEIFAELFKKLHEENRINDLMKIKKIDGNVNSKFWHHVLFNPYTKTMMRSKSYARSYLFYHFGIELSNNQLNSLKNNYKKYSEKELDLPKPIINFN